MLRPMQEGTGIRINHSQPLFEIGVKWFPCFVRLKFHSPTVGPFPFPSASMFFVFLLHNSQYLKRFSFRLFRNWSLCHLNTASANCATSSFESKTPQ